MAILIYLIKTILISGLLFSYYSMFLKNRPFHSFNRFFLLSIPFLSLLFPLLHLNLPVFGNQNVPVSPILLLNVSQGKLEEAVTVYANQHGHTVLSWQLVLSILSFVVTVLLLIRLLKSIFFIYRLRTNKPYLTLHEAIVYFVSEKGTPFSFFKSIFWGDDLDLNSKSGNQVLQHELFHVKNNHSLDILLLEGLFSIFWFNPFYYLIKQEMKAIHEYSADAWVTANTDTYSYASLLLLKVSASPLPLTHPFFKNQIKRRISMMTNSKKYKTLRLSRIMVIPVFALLICLFSFKVHNPLHLFSPGVIRVVIDAGHGGIDPGVTANGTWEKNINLSIAKKIQELAKEYNVDVIMTREKDELSGTGKDIRRSLKYRASLPRKENADLFISIHASGMSQNVLQKRYSGFQIYVPDNSSKVFGGSIKLASVIADYIKPDYAIDEKLKQRKAPILVLDNATVPAILIECGYLDNESDLKYLRDENNQEKIARDILEGIRKYSMQNISYVKLPANMIDSVPAIDTVTSATMNKIDPSRISSMRVDKQAGFIYIDTKDGKTYVWKITPEMRHSWDSAHNAEMKKNLDSNSDKIFTKVEVEAEYPGGYQAWYNYLQKNLKYPEAAVKKEIQGEVIVEFIVKRNGDLTGIHVISGPGELRESSLNILKESGKWLPAKQNGIIVESYHRQPINYKLE
jgi:N-acetylmuramoyl-L-alanine amidase